MIGAQIRKPPRLRAGDVVRLVAPASPFPANPFIRGRRALENLGLRTVMDRAERQRLGFLAGTDQQRAQRLNLALADAESRAVWCIRGGYGTARLLPLLRVPKEPRLVIGCSDITALLLRLSRPGGWVTVHGPVVTQMASSTAGARRWLKRLLFDPRPAGRVPLGRLKKVRGGRTRGFLYGGNLSLLTSLVGTPYLPPLAGAILFLEEVNESAYRLDRMWNQLRQSGLLDNLLGIVLGSLRGCKPARGKYSARSVFEGLSRELGIPVVSGANIGHQNDNIALPLGVLAELDADVPCLSLLEGAVE